ncbi:MAG: PDZ domain-containing protein [Planctomycetes bacterium]|nr:PDZ domain-containing protein [Planctomycetota bacterium]
MHQLSLPRIGVTALSLLTGIGAQIVPKVPKIPFPTKNAETPAPPADQPPAAPQPGAVEGGVGIAFQADPQGNLVIAQLAPGGAAERAKVPTGAVLRAVDGKRTAGLTIEQVRALCIGPVDSMVTLTVETPREVIDFVLQRRPLASAAGPGPQPTAPAANGEFPAWLRPGARATYFSGQATMPGVSTQLIPDESGFGWRDGNGRTYREEDVPSTGGGGLTQYDFVHVAADCIAAMQTIHVYTDAALRNTTLTSTQAQVGDRNGLTDLWVPPAKLRAMLQQETPGYRVRRVKYPLEGRTYDALVQQVKSDSSWQRYTYDLDTGLLLVFSASSTGAPVLTREGNQLQQGAGGTTITSVVLRNLRQVTLPWTGQGAATWLQPGKSLEYRGTYSNSLAAGTMAPWGLVIAATVEQRLGDCALTKLVTRIDYGTGQPQDSTSMAAYGPGSFGHLAIDPKRLAELQLGQVFDRDPLTGRQLACAASDGRTVTLVEQGPMDLQKYTYDRQSGVLIVFAQQQQQGPAVISIDTRLQQR